MLQRLKVWAFRKYYHFISDRDWKGHPVKPGYNPLQIPGGAGPLHARMYTTDNSADKPLIVYFHGGGWVIGDLDTHHPFCQVLSERTGCTVISLDYRLAPEHPFPAAHDDCLDATRWIADHIGDFGPSSGQLVIAGNGYTIYDPKGKEMQKVEGGWYDQDHFANFVNAIRNDEPLTQPIAEGQKSALLCHLGNIAYWLKRPLKWDPVKEEILGDPEARRTPADSRLPSRAHS